MGELRAADFAKEVKAGKFRPVYFLVGEEASARADAIAVLKAAFKADDFNLREFSGDLDVEAPSIVAEASTLPVFSDKRLVVVKTAKISASARATLAAYLRDPLKSTTLVLQSEERKPDAKDALAAAASAAGAVVVFSPLKDDEASRKLVAQAAQAGRKLSGDAAERLVAEAGTDWGVLSQELEKVLLYRESGEISVDDVRQCLGYQKAADPFALTRLIQDRRLKEALTHLARMMRDGKPDDVAFRALSQVSGAVSKQLRARRMLKAGTPREQAFRQLRLHQYWDRDYLERVEKLSEARLARDLRRCVATEADLKSKSWLDPRGEIERLIVDVCGGQALAAAPAKDI